MGKTWRNITITKDTKIHLDQKRLEMMNECGLKTYDDVIRTLLYIDDNLRNGGKIKREKIIEIAICEFGKSPSRKYIKKPIISIEHQDV